jgi:hypothetical protein
MNTSTTLNTLYIWVHAGYSVLSHGGEMTPEEEELLEANRLFCEMIADTKTAALAIIHYPSKENYESWKQGGNSKGHQRWTEVVEEVKAHVPQHVELFGFPVPHSSTEMVTSTDRALQEKGLACDTMTSLIGIGETSSSCVPGALCTFRETYSSLLPPVVLLTQTNARKADRRNNWKEGGVSLAQARRKYPSVIFKALPDDF